MVFETFDGILTACPVCGENIGPGHWWQPLCDCGVFTNQSECRCGYRQAGGSDYDKQELTKHLMTAHDDWELLAVRKQLESF